MEIYSTTTRFALACNTSSKVRPLPPPLECLVVLTIPGTHCCRTFVGRYSTIFYNLLFACPHRIITESLCECQAINANRRVMIPRIESTSRSSGY